MKKVIRWAIDNSAAMNILMLSILIVGSLSLVSMRREVFPEFQLDVVLVSVPYPGASPEEVEEGICQKIEEAIYAVDGIKKMTTVSKEGTGAVVLELHEGADAQRIVSEVRSEVDRISRYFPELSEDPEIQEITLREAAIKVGIVAPDRGGAVDEMELRDVTEWVRDELLSLKEVSEVELEGGREFQIDIEIEEDTLRKYGLTLQEVAAIVRRENLELPGGTLKSKGEEVLLRGKSKSLHGQQIAKIPLITDPNGVVLTAGDLGTVRDAFADTTAINEINGRTALVLSVNRTSSEDLLAMTAAVRQKLDKLDWPAGYDHVVWGDRSVDVRDRLEMLISNGVMGLILVFLVLAVFLELKLAFWVALGIPVALLGAGSALLFGGQTLNMLSMFAFLMALGIVVDDAIVVGENIYSHRQSGKGYIQAAIDGTVEVVPSVVASVMTTVIAFCPLFFVAGIMGKFIAVLPFAVVAMLIISLCESMLILPCHLAHRDNLFFHVFAAFFWPLSFVVRFFAAVSTKTNATLDTIVERFYRPLLERSIRNCGFVIAGAVAMLLVTVGFVRAGIVPFEFFPKLDSNYLQAKIVFPDGTPASVTDKATRQIVDALHRVDRDYAEADASVVKLVYRGVGQVTGTPNPADGGRGSGSHVGMIEVELTDTSERHAKSEEITNKWRDAVGTIPGVDSLTFGVAFFGPGGKPIEFKLLAPAAESQQLEAALEECKAVLREYRGVFDVADDSRPGKWELQVRIKDRAKSMGITNADLAETIRAAYYGAEVMRLQRGRHEVKLMVRFPADQRHSLADFEDIRVRVAGNASQRSKPTGAAPMVGVTTSDAGSAEPVEIPIGELADIKVVRGYSEINRVDRMRSITVSADVDAAQNNAYDIVNELKNEDRFSAKVGRAIATLFGREARKESGFIDRLTAKYPAVKVRWEGQEEQRKESMGSLFRGAAVAILVMFCLLTLEFRTYLQPLLILAIIPFGIIGAIFGHAVMGLPMTLFSFFGLVALTGVVVNDSIVLIDFINRQVRDGVPVDEALVNAGARRFRPVLLTSMTTIAGLFPILIETSFQAQILIPMATSLSFGLLLATIIVLGLVPVLCRVYYSVFPFNPAAEEDHDEPSTTSGLQAEPLRVGPDETIEILSATAEREAKSRRVS